MNRDDLLLGPVIGGVSSTRANLWARSIDLEDIPAMLHAWIGRLPDLSDAKLMGKSMPLSKNQGYAGVAPVNGLIPNTQYYYAVTLDEMPPKSKNGIYTNGEYPSFKTFPEPGTACTFNFAFGSCFKPGKENSGHIFDALDQQRQKDDLRFLILMGDQIYADDSKTNSLGKVAETLDEYRRVYQFNWSNLYLRQLLWNIPVFMILDDHEVDDDWRWRDEGRTKPYIPWWDSLVRWLGGCSPSERQINKRKVRAALQVYWEHQGMHAPPLIDTPTLDNSGGYLLPKVDPGSLAFTFEYGPAAFFVIDTRTMRVKPRGPGHRTMLGERQWAHLKDWLFRVKDVFPIKFLISSSSLLYTSLLDMPQDRWSGYSNERDQLLNYIASNGIEGVYILSGDFHFGFAIRAELYGPQGQGLPVWEFCSSPFEQSISKLAANTRVNIRNGLFKRQERIFKLTEPNFGVVRVVENGDSAPRVRFKLFNSAGEMLRST